MTIEQIIKLLAWIKNVIKIYTKRDALASYYIYLHFLFVFEMIYNWTQSSLCALLSNLELWTLDKDMCIKSESVDRDTVSRRWYNWYILWIFDHINKYIAIESWYLNKSQIGRINWIHALNVWRKHGSPCIFAVLDECFTRKLILGELISL